METADELHARTLILGALLQRAVGAKSRLIIVGGSAIAIWTSGGYVSGDVDLVGPRAQLEPVLAAWGFVKTDDPDGRAYWGRPDLGLLIDVINRIDYVGHLEGLLRVQTPYGPVHVAAVEDLILRRLVFWKRGGRPEMLDQAVALFLQNRQKLDEEYLAVMTRNERIEDAYAQMERLADATTGDAPPRTGRRS